MANPLYFDPDPTIPDSDLSGYGDLIFDDGSKRFINGDPEIVQMFPPTPTNDVSMGPPVDPAPPERGQYMPDVSAGLPPGISVDMHGNIDTTGGSNLDPTEAVGKNEPIVSRAGMPSQQPGLPQQSSDQLPGMPQINAPGSDLPLHERGKIPVPIQGAEDHSVIPATGEIVPTSGYGSGGLQLASREGAIPQGMAAQQQSEMQGAQNASLQATIDSRNQQVQIQRDATNKRLGELQAEKQHQEDIVKEQQLKQERLRKEQQETSDMKIETGLVAQQGGFSAAMAVLGAALLGYVGSDAGLRMIESTVDRNVKLQLGRRDSKLKLLADKLGSSEEATAAAKGILYKTMADKAEQMQNLTKADAFEAQTPEIVAQLRQKSMEQMQERDRLNLGKPLEKAPVAPKPVAPAQVDKYGKAAASQQQSQLDAQRALKAIGGRWNAETKQIENRDEILKKGIPGVGTWDTFVDDLGNLPFGIGEIPKAADNAVTSQEGKDIRASLQGLIQAQARSNNPNGVISNKDVTAARDQLGMNTEKGVVEAIERVLGQQGTLKAQAVSQFGPEAASVYEGRMKQQGQDTSLPKSFGNARPLEPGSARDAVKQERTPPSSGNSAEDSLRKQGLISDGRKQGLSREGYGPSASADPMHEVAGEVQKLAGNDLPPEGLAILTAQAAHETDDGKHAPNNNMFGHKASGGRPSASLMTTEGEGKDAKRVKQNFAKYDTVSESVADHIGLIKRNYPDAWSALQHGDTAAYVAALKDGGYFTGNESVYLKSLQRRM